MLKHIVVWTMKPETSLEQKQEMKARLESLAGKIPELRFIEVGIDSGNGTMSLYSEFDNEDALIAYQVHPDHQAVVGFVKPLVAVRTVCDYVL
ncbi:MAG: Dabb family protein [Kiritimatiellaceae bacterium]|nr:Dabb family protein [Kiritimatiellaceae bacterium]